MKNTARRTANGGIYH